MSGSCFVGSINLRAESPSFSKIFELELNLKSSLGVRGELGLLGSFVEGCLWSEIDSLFP